MTTHNIASNAFRDSQARALTLASLPMPADTVTGNYISAGWLLSEMDKAGGWRAHKYIDGRAVTVSVDAMSFHKPVYVGDLVKIHTEVVRQGRSSLTLKVESWAERRDGYDYEKVTEGLFTFVAVDKDHNPVEIKTNNDPTNPVLVPPGAGVKRAAAQANPVPPPAATLTMQDCPQRKDTNYMGDIFGGWILSKMDKACSETAGKYTGHEVASVGIEAMTFYKPVMVGDNVSFYTEVVKTGQTSVMIKVETWAARLNNGKHEKVTEGLFTYVALDKNRKTVNIAPKP